MKKYNKSNTRTRGVEDMTSAADAQMDAEWTRGQIDIKTTAKQKRLLDKIAKRQREANDG
jgi:hypothetical protein